MTAASRSLRGRPRGRRHRGRARGPGRRCAFQPRYEQQQLADLDIDVTESARGHGRPRAAAPCARWPTARRVGPARGGGRGGRRRDRALVAPTKRGRSGAHDPAHRRRAHHRHRPRARASAWSPGTDRGQRLPLVLCATASRASPASRPSGDARHRARLAARRGHVPGRARRTASVSGWFAARLRDDDDEPRMVRAHDFAPQGSRGARRSAPPPATRASSPWARTAASCLRYLTSERTLARALRARAAPPRP